MIKMMTRKKIVENKKEGIIHRDIKDNEIETNWNIFKKVIEERPDDTISADMEECVNDEDDDEKEKKYRE